jgi:hypothetical protein
VQYRTVVHVTPLPTCAERAVLNTAGWSLLCLIGCKQVQERAM